MPLSISLPSILRYCRGNKKGGNRLGVRRPAVDG
jgi:hypothetical protein